MPESSDPLFLGHIVVGDSDTSERATVRAGYDQRSRLVRNQYVTIADAVAPQTVFLGRLVDGPFFPAVNGDAVAAQAVVEVLGERQHGRTYDTNDRPTPGSVVRELPPEEVRAMVGLEGDMLLGCLAGRQSLAVSLDSKSKDVLPRNVGIFGTVGSGKSNSVQVLVEEAAARGWAVVVLDLEAEYVEMDRPSEHPRLVERLAQYGRRPEGLADFHVYHPIKCEGEREDSQPFTLRVADYDSSIIAELMHTTLAERNALLECIDHFQHRFQTQVATRDASDLFDAAPQTKLPYTVQGLRSRAMERSPRGTESLDFTGLTSKLNLLLHSGAFDVAGMRGLDVPEMLRPGRVSVIDVSVANDTVKNLVTADLLRKAFAFKMARSDAPPTLLVIEEAHSFMSRDRIHAMQATLQMLRNVTRRGRKRWLAVAFVSQQPGHLPPEIFELCNTRLVHTLRSMHNLDTLMATTSDVTKELWARCPLLGTGEAIVSTPQFHRSVVTSIRPAASNRRFVR